MQELVEDHISQTDSSGTAPLSSGLGSPKSLRNRPKLTVSCPPPVRKRSASDSNDLPYEVAESVLLTPTPLSPRTPRDLSPRVLLARQNSTSSQGSASSIDDGAPPRRAFWTELNEHPSAAASQPHEIPQPLPFSRYSASSHAKYAAPGILDDLRPPSPPLSAGPLKLHLSSNGAPSRPPGLSQRNGPGSMLFSGDASETSSDSSEVDDLGVLSLYSSGQGSGFERRPDPLPHTHTFSKELTLHGPPSFDLQGSLSQNHGISARNAPVVFLTEASNGFGHHPHFRHRGGGIPYRDLSLASQM
jgi:hypothetical protein